MILKINVLNDVCSISFADLFKSFAKIYTGLVPDEKTKSTDSKSLCQNIRKRGFVKFALNDPLNYDTYTIIRTCMKYTTLLRMI